MILNFVVAALYVHCTHDELQSCRTMAITTRFFGGSCKPLRCHFQTDDAMFESDTPETKHFIYFYVGSLAILIWKS